MKITRQQLKRIILEELKNMPQGDEPVQGKPPEAEAEAAPEPGKIQQMIAAKLEPATQLPTALKIATRNVQSAEEAINYWLDLLGQNGLDPVIAMQALKKVVTAKSKEPKGQ